MKKSGIGDKKGTEMKGRQIFNKQPRGGVIACISICLRIHRPKFTFVN